MANTRKQQLLFSLVVTIGLTTFGTAVVRAQDVLPRPAQPFKGKIGRTVKDSTPDFPKEILAPPGAPNILLIMTDDVGFAASSPFGGPIPTPTFERLAASGLRYTQFHTTALCSPTRAALITGRNHHSNASGVVMELGTGYPGYHTLMPKSSGSIAEVLKQHGYNTSWYGKNHNVPDWHTSQAGPFDLWPTGLGFEYFYGFIGADTNQWRSAIYENTRPVTAEEQRGDHPVHFDQLMADHAIAWLRMQHGVAPNKPFFAYYAPGTSHAPHHAPKEWITRFKGQFDKGWDQVREDIYARQKQMGIIPADAKLTPRPKEIPSWESMSGDQHRLYARMMNRLGHDPGSDLLLRGRPRKGNHIGLPLPRAAGSVPYVVASGLAHQAERGDGERPLSFLGEEIGRHEIGHGAHLRLPNSFIFRRPPA